MRKEASGGDDSGSEDTEIRSSSSPFTDSLSTPSAPVHLLSNFIKVLNSFGEEDAEETKTAVSHDEASLPNIVLKEQQVRRPSSPLARWTEDAQTGITSRRAERASFMMKSQAPEMLTEMKQFQRPESGEAILVSDIPLLLRSYGCNPTLKDCQTICDNIRNDYGDTISMEVMFDILIEEEMKSCENDTESIISIFEAFDSKRKGTLDKRVLEKILTSRGERLTPEEWALFVKEAGPGKAVDYRTFVTRMDRNIYLGDREKRRKLIQLIKKEELDLKRQEKRRKAEEEARRLEEEIAKLGRKKPDDEGDSEKTVEE